MTQRQINLLAMYNAVLRYMDDHSDAWATITLIADKKSEMAESIAEISGKGIIQQQKNPKGYTSDKNAALETMTGLAYKIALRVKAFARKNRNAVLLQAVSYSQFALETGPETEMINRCALIAGAATDNLGSLSAYKVTADDIEALTDAIDAARPKSAERDAVGGERTAITGNLQQLFSEAREHATELDDLVEGLVDDPDFVESYFAVRRINDRRGGRSQQEKAPAPQEATS